MTLEPSALAAVTRPVGDARGLPNAAYVDAAAFEAEKARVFFRGWAGIGFAADVPGPGDARPLDFLGQPLLMLRDREGVLRVFYNVCRHRGMVLVNQPGNIRRAIRCPYQSWCYELDGRLRTTPHVGGLRRRALLAGDGQPDAPVPPLGGGADGGVSQRPKLDRGSSD